MKSGACFSKAFFCSQILPMRIEALGSSSTQNMPDHRSGWDQVSVNRVRVMDQVHPACGCNHTHTNPREGALPCVILRT